MEPPQYNGGLLGLQKREYLAKYNSSKKIEEMALFDLQTVGFWALKNATLIADTHTPGPILLSDPATSNRGDRNLNRQESP